MIIVLSHHRHDVGEAARLSAQSARSIVATPVSAAGRVPRRDRLSEGAFISVELAPIVLPRRVDIVAAVRSVIGLGPNTRAGRTFAGRRWSYDPAALDQQAERMVKQLPDWYTGSSSLPQLRSAIEPELPFTVFLGPDTAALCIDHRLGDGFLSVLLAAAVFGRSGIPASLVDADDGNPLPAALLTTFVRHPDRFLEIVHDRGRERAAGGSGEPPSTTAVEGRSLELETGVMDWGTYQSLVRWARGKAPTTVAMIFALRGALVRSGIGVGETGAILVDLRRYLPSGRSTLANFVVGQPLSLVSGVGAAGDRFAHDLRLGRPLAALTAGLSRPTRRGPVSSRPVLAAAAPTVSDMGFLRALESIPWATDEPAVSVSVDTAARNGITALTSVLRRRMNVSLSFDGAVFDRTRVADACELFCTDPIGLIE